MRNFLDFAGIASISFGRLSCDSAKKREKTVRFFSRPRYNIVGREEIEIALISSESSEFRRIIR